MTRNSNYQDILKIIALICMIIDHIGLYFFPETWILRAVGRYAFPIFCFFAGFNFKNSLRFKTLIYGIALYLFTTAVIFEQIIEANILISIFVGYVYLIIFQSLPPYPELNQANEFKSEAAQRTSVREYSRVLKIRLYHLILGMVSITTGLKPVVWLTLAKRIKSVNAKILIS